MQATIVVTKASVNNGWRNIVDQNGVRYSLSKKGNVPDLFVGQTVTIEYTEKQSDDGKFTNRYVTGWTPAGGPSLAPPAANPQQFRNPYDPPAPFQQAPPPLASRAPEDPKADSMAKLNAYNNAVALAIAKLNFYNNCPAETRLTAPAAFRLIDDMIPSKAREIYKNTTGRTWEGFEEGGEEEDAF